jgi:Terminase large subunit, T4likevirus-type, N-terminal
MRHLGLEPDPWQLAVLESGHPRQLLNCSRQAGKSTVAALALAEAVFTDGALVLLVSRSHRQSRVLFGMVADFYPRLREPLLLRRTADELTLTNNSRVVSLPCQEETIRGYSGVTRLIIDEASRVPDNVYRAVRPMLAASRGRLICLSTPYGRRGFFYQAWTEGGPDWMRVEVSADKITRIPAEFLEEERRARGEAWFRQEYCCSFEATEGLVYPDFARAVVAGTAPTGGRRVGGIDFGYSNPFAAVWGVVDRDRVLWLTGEHYARQKSLAFHVAHLPRDVAWYCDPAGARERVELLSAGLKVQKGLNPIRPGVMAVSARVESGRLKVVAGACPNPLSEASLYRYPEGGGSEVPEDDHNHAVGALRYLVSRLDERRMARPGWRLAPEDPDEQVPTLPARPVFRSPGELLDDPEVWSMLS